MAGVSPFQFALRSLRVEGRDARAFAARALTLALLAAMMTLDRGPSFHATAAGLLLLRAITWMVITLIFLALAFFAAPVADEREAGVLDLVRLTGARPVAVFGGLFMESLIRPMLLLVGLSPLLLLSYALGGVTAADVGLALLHLLQALLLAHALGLLLSTLVPTTFAASCIGYAVVGAALLSPALFDLVVQVCRWTNFTLLIPGVRGAEQIFRYQFLAGLIPADAGFSVSHLRFGLGLRAGLILGCWSLAAWRFCRAESRPVAGVPRTSAVRRPRRPRARPTSSMAIVWKQRTTDAPGRFFGQGYRVFLLLLGVTALSFPESEATVLVCFLVWGIAGIRMQLEAWLMFWGEQRSGTLDALALLPGGMRRVLAEKVRASLRHTPIELTVAIACATSAYWQGPNSAIVYIIALCFCFATAAAYGTAVVSLWFPYIAPAGGVGGVVLILAGLREDDWILPLFIFCWLMQRIGLARLARLYPAEPLGGWKP